MQAGRKRRGAVSGAIVGAGPGVFSASWLGHFRVAQDLAGIGPTRLGVGQHRSPPAPHLAAALCCVKSGHGPFPSLVGPIQAECFSAVVLTSGVAAVFLGSASGCARADAESIQCHFGVDLGPGRGSLWHRLRVDLGSLSGRSGIDLMSWLGRCYIDTGEVSGRLGVNLGPIWGRSVATAGSEVGRLGVTLGAIHGLSASPRVSINRACPERTHGLRRRVDSAAVRLRPGAGPVASAPPPPGAPR